MIRLCLHHSGVAIIALVGATASCGSEIYRVNPNTSATAAAPGRAHQPLSGDEMSSIADQSGGEKWEVTGPPPATNCRILNGDPQSRLHMVEAVGRYVNLGHLACSGYYTMVIFASPSCAPCREILAQAPNWLNRYPNLVLVDVNVGDADGPQWEVLRDLNFVGQGLPLGVLLGPLGHLMFRMSGAQDIQARLAKLDGRWHKRVIWGAADATFAPPISDAGVPNETPAEPRSGNQQETRLESAPAPKP